MIHYLSSTRGYSHIFTTSSSVTSHRCRHLFAPRGHIRAWTKMKMRFSGGLFSHVPSLCVTELSLLVRVPSPSSSLSGNYQGLAMSKNVIMSSEWSLAASYTSAGSAASSITRYAGLAALSTTPTPIPAPSRPALDAGTHYASWVFISLAGRLSASPWLLVPRRAGHCRVTQNEARRAQTHRDGGDSHIKSKKIRIW